MTRTKLFFTGILFATVGLTGCANWSHQEKGTAAGAVVGGIFAATDTLAALCLTELRAEGLAVPEDVRLVGFDDLPMASRVWPNLTTVRLPIRDMGRMAAEKLLAPTRGVDPAKLEQPEVRPALVVRHSAIKAG